MLPVLVSSLALTACGKSEEGSGANKTLAIGVLAPLSGSDSATGKGIRNGVELAVKAANEQKLIKGVTLTTEAEDDQAKPKIGAIAIAKLIANKSVVGVVGPLNSGVAKGDVAKAASDANLALVSPSNSNVDLTGRGALATGGTQTRPYKSYFRVCATDDLQGPFDATYAVTTLGKKRIAVVHNKQAYGQGLAESFKKAATAAGATVLPIETVNKADTDYSATVTKIKAEKPDLLFYGGEYADAGRLTKQMKAGGLTIPLMGGDGMFSSSYVTGGGAATEGDLASSLGAPTDSLATAKAFLTTYKAANYDVPADPYAAAAFDAANAIIKALAKAAGEGKSGQELRDEVTKKVQDSDFDGITSHISFDQFGDTNSKILTIFQVKSGKFAPIKTEAVK